VELILSVWPTYLRSEGEFDNFVAEQVKDLNENMKKAGGQESTPRQVREVGAAAYYIDPSLFVFQGGRVLVIATVLRRWRSQQRRFLGSNERPEPGAASFARSCTRGPRVRGVPSGPAACTEEIALWESHASGARACPEAVSRSGPLRGRSGARIAQFRQASEAST
jgi:hypothetical protein